MKIMITGPQGSGKSTQAKILSDKLNLCYIGTGDIMRQLAEENSAQGRRIKDILNQGKLIDDELAVKLVKEKINNVECKNGFVTDGYPRTVAQHQLFDPEFDKVFYLKVANTELEKRLLARGRVDDSLDLIRERLNWYHKETQTLLDYYQKTGKLVVINGEQAIDKIAEEIESKVELKAEHD